MAQHGGKRPGAGRRPGKVSAAKRSLADMAKGHASAALKTLADVASKGDSESARVAAAVAILDRAYGRPSMIVEGAGDDDAPALNINIATSEPVSNIRVTRSKG